MKATFFSFAALAVSAVSAMAVPAANANLAQRDAGDNLPTGKVSSAVHDVDSLVVEDLGVGEIVEGATAGAPLKRDLADSADLVQLLTTLLEDIKGSTGSINETLSSVQDGETSKEDATTAAAKDLSTMHFKLTEIVTKLTSAAGIPVADSDVDTVLNLVVALLAEVLATVNSLVTILGLRIQLISLLHSVFELLAKVVTLVIGLVAAIVPGLVAALSPLLAGLGNGLLAPLLTPLVALVAGLATA